VLIVLADHASADGTNAWPSVATIAAEARISERSARYALRALEAGGHIEHVSEGPKGTRNYTVLTPGAKSAPPGAKSAGEGGAKSAGEGGQPLPPNRPKGNRPKSLSLSGGMGGPGGNGTPPLPAEVSGKKVTTAELTLALGVLEAFNLRADTQFTPAPHLPSIVRRIREHPRLELEGHRKIIAAVFKRPWWKDRPAPNVIYGNAAVFERSMEESRKGGGPKHLADWSSGSWADYCARQTAKMNGA
jgi:hypothetical protein